MNPKKRPHHEIYLQALQGMTPEQRLAKAFELGEMGEDVVLSKLSWSALAGGSEKQFQDATGWARREKARRLWVRRPVVRPVTAGRPSSGAPAAPRHRSRYRIPCESP